MSADLIIPKNEAENVDKIFHFYKESSLYINQLKKLKDPSNEKIYQHGVRPKSGQSNDPDRLYTEEAHIMATINSVNPELVPEEKRGMLKPAATLYEWVFKRLCIDLKNMAQLPEEHFLTYISLIDEGVKESNDDMTEIKAKYPDLSEELSTKEFMNLNPEQQHYFFARLNAVTFEAVSSILKVIYCQWYPTAK